MKEKQKKFVALVLLPMDAQRLKEAYSISFPAGWVWKGHHMTLHLGEATAYDKPLIGKTFKVLATHNGKSPSTKGEDLVRALKIEPGILNVESGNPHITLCVDEFNGGESFMSNSVSEWYEMPPMLLEGQVMEVRQ